MSELKQLLIGCAIVTVMLVTHILAPVETQPRAADAVQPAAFDHSRCQYPDRWSNPADGCDNSDPAVPECIKAFSTKEGEAECIAQFVKLHEPVVTEPIIEMEGK